MYLIPGRPSQTGLTWWLLAPPEVQPRLRLSSDGAHPIHSAKLEELRSGNPDRAGDIYAIAINDLQPDTTYELEASGDGTVSRLLSRTLPENLSLATSFSVALGSCYSFATHHNLGRWYPPATHLRDDNPIRLRFLCGDQIYMDLEPSDGRIVLSPPDPLDRYMTQWPSRHFRGFVQASPTITLADDHEFWNNYPHRPAWLRWAEDHPGGPLGRKMDSAFSAFQAALNLDPGDLASADGDSATLRRLLRNDARSFQIDVPPLSFFVLDTRSRRTRCDEQERHFCLKSWLTRALRWLENLRGPGILVVAQVVVAGRAKNPAIDAGLPDYPEDFKALCDAIFNAPHDVLILTGDIHWSRLYALKRKDDGGPRVFELVSSPLSRIPKLPFEDLLKTYPGEVRGEFRWGRGKSRIADWSRGEFLTGELATYATVTLSVPPTGDGIDVRAVAWGWSWDSQHATAVAADEFHLD